MVPFAQVVDDSFQVRDYSESAYTASNGRDVTLDIVMVCAEAIPFAKTGGLADVCGSLPSRLAALGHRCSVFMPAYAKALQAGYAMHDTHVGFVLDMNGKHIAARITKATLEEGPLIFISSISHITMVVQICTAMNMVTTAITASGLLSSVAVWFKRLID